MVSDAAADHAQLALDLSNALGFPLHVMMAFCCIDGRGEIKPWAVQGALLQAYLDGANTGASASARLVTRLFESIEVDLGFFMAWNAELGSTFGWRTPPTVSHNGLNARHGLHEVILHHLEAMAHRGVTIATMGKVPHEVMAILDRPHEIFRHPNGGMPLDIFLRPCQILRSLVRFLGGFFIQVVAKGLDGAALLEVQARALKRDVVTWRLPLRNGPWGKAHENMCAQLGALEEISEYDWDTETEVDAAATATLFDPVRTGILRVKVLPASSGFRGVKPLPSGRYRVVYWNPVNYKDEPLGTWATAAVAAAVYDEYRRRRHGRNIGGCNLPPIEMSEITEEVKIFRTMRDAEPLEIWDMPYNWREWAEAEAAKKVATAAATALAAARAAVVREAAGECIGVRPLVAGTFEATGTFNGNNMYLGTYSNADVAAGLRDAVTREEQRLRPAGRLKRYNVRPLEPRETTVRLRFIIVKYSVQMERNWLEQADALTEADRIVHPVEIPVDKKGRRKWIGVVNPPNEGGLYKIQFKCKTGSRETEYLGSDKCAKRAAALADFRRRGLYLQGGCGKITGTTYNFEAPPPAPDGATVPLRIFARDDKTTPKLILYLPATFDDWVKTLPEDSPPIFEGPQPDAGGGGGGGPGGGGGKKRAAGSSGAGPSKAPGPAKRQKK